MFPTPYVIVTPVKDEERFVGATVDSVLAQSHPPVRWIIVDDGSTDSTRQIVLERTCGVPWITLLETTSRIRNLGIGEVLAFQTGLSEVKDDKFAFLVKLDADVRLAPDYFEKIISRMSANPRWGIASGLYWEERAGTWWPARMPHYHAAGACKVVRRTCYEQIGGFVPEKGWDTLDEIRAGMRGWKTGHFADIRFDHLKPEGAAMGQLAMHRFHGEIYYRTGGGLLFLLPKVIHRMIWGRPAIAGGLSLLQAYISGWIRGEDRIVTKAEARFYRRLLMARARDLLARRRQNPFPCREA